MSAVYPGDTFTVNDAESLFADALKSEGLSVDSIEAVSYSDDSGFEHKVLFHVTKDINGDVYKTRCGFSLAHREMQLDDAKFVIREKIARVARAVREEIEAQMLERINLRCTTVEVCTAEGGWAKCKRCGEKVTLDEFSRGAGWLSEAELSNPTPTPYDTRNFLRKLTRGQKEVLRLYLIGALRTRCNCEFGKYQNDYVNRNT